MPTEQLPVPASPEAPREPIPPASPIQGPGQKLKQFLAKAGIALGIMTGASHGVGTKAEGMVENAFDPIHDTLRPGGTSTDTENSETESGPRDAWERARDTLGDALDWSTNAAGNILKGSELSQKIDQTFTDLLTSALGHPQFL